MELVLLTLDRDDSHFGVNTEEAEETPAAFAPETFLTARVVPYGIFQGRENISVVLYLGNAVPSIAPPICGALLNEI